jgi:rubrerythrin
MKTYSTTGRSLKLLASSLSSEFMGLVIIWACKIYCVPSKDGLQLAAESAKKQKTRLTSRRLTMLRTSAEPVRMVSMACRLLSLVKNLPHQGSGCMRRAMVSVAEKIGDYLTSTKISREILRDKLSEFLAVERGGSALYAAAFRLVFDREVSSRFKVFREQTRKHESILLGVIEALGMDGDYLSPGAKIAQQKAVALVKTMTYRGLTARTAELNAIENIVLAETKDHADWEFLGKIARQCEDRKLREVLQPAVSEVEPQEDEHLNWTKQQLARLSFSDVCEKAPLRATRRKQKTTRKTQLSRSKRVAKDKRRKKTGAGRARTTKPMNGYRPKRRTSAHKKSSRE